MWKEMLFKKGYMGLFIGVKREKMFTLFICGTKKSQEIQIPDESGTKFPSNSF